MKRTLPALLLLFALVVLAAVTLAGLVWANRQWVMYLPEESEFLYRWEVTRGLVFEQANPYEPLDGYHFTAPLPVLVFYFPFALVKDHNLARALWITASQVAALGFAALTIRSAAWAINRWAASALLLFAALWFPAAAIYVRGSEAILMAALFSGGVYLLQKEQDEIAGVLLTLAALQWTLTWPGVLLTLLWAASRRRWVFHFWSAVTFLGASALVMLFVPAWPVDFFWATLRYVDFRVGRAVLEITTGWWPGVGKQIGWGIVLFGGILLIAEWWLAWGRDSRHLTWTLALTWAASIWIGIAVNVDNVFLLLAALIVAFSVWSTRWGQGGLAVSLGLAALLLTGTWWRAVSGGLSAPLLFLGLPLLALIGLYWVRWWYLRAAYFRIEG